MIKGSRDNVDYNTSVIVTTLLVQMATRIVCCTLSSLSFLQGGDLVMESTKGKKRTAKDRSTVPIKRILLAAAELTLVPDSIISSIFSQLDALGLRRVNASG